MENRTVRVRDLKDDPPYGELLKCFHCANEYSACRRDYFMADPRTAFKCCGFPMALVTKQTVFKPAA